MSGKRQKTQHKQLLLAFARKVGVKPRTPTAEGPNHWWRSEHPKARQKKNV